MKKKFNTTAICLPAQHYMVDMDERVAEILTMVRDGKYFVINRPRQYGKTTLLRLISDALRKDYMPISLDFQNLDEGAYANAGTFARTLGELILDGNAYGEYEIPKAVIKEFEALQNRDASVIRMINLFAIFRKWIASCEKPVVLLIDEVDSAASNQVFLDFLAQLRGGYNKRDIVPTFQSVILAGVTDIRNLKRKIRKDEEARLNSPWNIAADVAIRMSFSTDDIAGMLREYEKDCQTGMDIDAVAGEVYAYSSGYPFLVSRICQIIDERIIPQGKNVAEAWSTDGISSAVGLLLREDNTLFQSLTGTLYNNQKMRQLVYGVLMRGDSLSYNPLNDALQQAKMYGFLTMEHGIVAIANRIFETLLYNMFLSEEELNQNAFSLQAKQGNSSSLK